MAVEAIAINYDSTSRLWQWSHTATDSTVTTGPLEAQVGAFHSAQRAFPTFPTTSITTGAGPSAPSVFDNSAPNDGDVWEFSSTGRTWHPVSQTVAGGAPAASPTFTGTVTLAAGVNVATGTVTGSQLASTTNQLLGFWGTTAVGQPLGTTELVTSLKAIGLLSAGATPITVGGAFVASGTAALNGTVTIGQGINVVLNSTTGSQLGTATNQLLGFWGATAVARPGVFTQTYSTAARTVPNSTVSSVTTAPAGLAIYGYTQAQADAIPVAINALAADVVALKQVVNALIDDHQSIGIAG